MALMMLIVTNKTVLGRFRARPSLAWGGWGATALMAITVLALLWSLLVYMSPRDFSECERLAVIER